jgi:hypothetical protein
MRHVLAQCRVDLADFGLFVDLGDAPFSEDLKALLFRQLLLWRSLKQL